MRVSVIVPVYNTAEHLEACILALKNQDYPSDEYEILMVDNNSTDNSPEILAQAKGIRALHEPKQGSYAARNRALQEARGSIVAFTDSDCMPEPDWLRAIEQALSVPGVKLALGVRRPVRSHGLVKLLSDYEDKKAKVIFSSDSEEMYYGFTNNMGVLRQACDRYGPFEELTRGADVIFVRRVVQGERCSAVIYSDTIKVKHAEMDSIHSYCKKMYIYGRSRQLYRHIVKTRPLSFRRRLEALRACLRDERYSWLETLLLIGSLLVAISYWSLGIISLRWRKA